MNDLSANIPGLTLVKPDPERDALFAYAWFSSPGGVETLLSMGNSSVEPTTIDKERDRLASFLQLEKENKQLLWMMRIDEKTIGAAWIDLEKKGLVNAPSVHLMIGDTTYRGRGIGPEVLRTLIEYVRVVLKSDTVYSRNLVKNSRIAKINEAVGLVNDGPTYSDEDGLVWQNTKMRLSI